VCRTDCPSSAPAAQVFAQFGSLAPNNRAVNLKSQKDKPSFAFIEFEQPASASAAITGPVRCCSCHFLQPFGHTASSVEYPLSLPDSRTKKQSQLPPGAGHTSPWTELLSRTASAVQVVIDGQTVRVDEKKPLYLLRGRGGRGYDGGRGAGRFDGGRGGYFGRGPGGRGSLLMAGRGPGRGTQLLFSGGLALSH